MPWGVNIAVCQIGHLDAILVSNVYHFEVARDNSVGTNWTKVQRPNASGETRAITK